MKKLAVAQWNELEDRKPAHALVGDVDLRLAHMRFGPAIASPELIAIICRSLLGNTGCLPAKCHIFCILPTFKYLLMTASGAVDRGAGRHP